MPQKNPLRITPFENRSKSTSWRVSGYLPDGPRIRKNFSSKADAIRFRNQRWDEHLAQGAIKYHPTHLSLEEVREAETAKALLKGKSLLDAVNHYMQSVASGDSGILYNDALFRYCEELEEHTGAGHFRIARGTLLKFGEYLEEIGQPNPDISHIKSEQIHRYIATKDPAPKTYNNRRSDFNAFFRWCIKPPRKWLAVNPVSELPPYRKARLPSREIVTVEEARLVMQHAERYQGGAWAGFFTLALFFGVRPDVRDGEIRRIHETGFLSFWNAQTGVIRLPARVCKNDKERIIPAQPNARAWVDKYLADGQPLLPATNDWAKSKARVIRDAGGKELFRLGHDVLRHSFCSYRLGQCQSLGETALEAGDLEETIRTHYIYRITKEDALRFWDIWPGAR